MKLLFWLAMFATAATIGVVAGNYVADLSLSAQSYARVF